MSHRSHQIAIVYPGDSEARRIATPSNNRFANLFAAFAARGVDARPAVYNRDQMDELREQLLQVDAALVWVNPIQDGHPRDLLDALLREISAEGVFVSTHPDVILQLGTKDVLVDTREMGWGSDVHRLDDLAQLRVDVSRRLSSGSPRVLKQWRGHSGIGVWSVRRVSATTSENEQYRVRARHAQRGNIEQEMCFDEFVALMAPYFADGGHMIDQAWQSRLNEGMVRCYLVQDRVQGFGVQAVNALYPVTEDASEPPVPGPRHYHPPTLSQFQSLKHRLETEWVFELTRRLGIAADRLPLLWDCDFLLAETSSTEEERYVLCEINVSSVAPFPDSIIEPLVEATLSRSERTA